MITITHGAAATGRPTFCARSTRNASEKRASVNTAANVTMIAYLWPSRRTSAMRTRFDGSEAGAAPTRSGSSTPTTSSSTASAAGITAIQNTRRKLSAKYSIAAIAIRGPPTAPTVSSAWRSPKLAPRTASGVMSAISASRGAPRMPFPIRSAMRAPTIQPSDGASGKTGLVSAASPYPSTTSALRRRKKSERKPENTLTISAVASANPSRRPIVSVLAPSSSAR